MNTPPTAPPQIQFSLIVTCKGRLEHLKETLPRFVRQPRTQVIVVDYTCPDKTGDFVAAHFPRALVVRVEDREYFNIAAARNAGAAVAKTPYLIFVDADTLLVPNFSALVSARLTRSNFLRFHPESGNSLGGTCVVATRDFNRIQGFDEVFAGYGGEDLDFYWRLQRMGVALRMLKADKVVASIEHGHSERTTFYAVKDMKRSFLQARAYRLVKEVLLGLSLHGELPLERRQEIWADVAAALAEDRFEIKVKLPGNSTSGFLNDWTWQRDLLVSFDKIVKGSSIPKPQG